MSRISAKGIKKRIYITALLEELLRRKQLKSLAIVLFGHDSRKHSNSEL
jgi:hypothetical protein